MRMIRVGLIFGGKSAEHEVSLQAARNISGCAGPTAIRGGADRHRLLALDQDTPSAIANFGGMADRLARVVYVHRIVMSRMHVGAILLRSRMTNSSVSHVQQDSDGWCARSI
ncbi:D-alanine-D-alanine ligase A [Xanthomonas citri pv. fuscans]|nr:D-alanine--D-alanine ligase A [Xanthomonas citri pv. fuscans]SON77575.1 D-alanine-D-alanine ligase A [Xanthomonas citri pv. fuscans]SON98576.1 D-alanine-D-alanine ligase A [Xanthomonas citri pv. fuscans]SOO05303.1 D-alanine-D-alanine ligase A [Xanthomonas citri pv. fuscans]SOO08945.1 D-alanine-D-alanine ligase A [Xanthomonas citri pv. fuscans]